MGSVLEGSKLQFLKKKELEKGKISALSGLDWVELWHNSLGIPMDRPERWDFSQSRIPGMESIGMSHSALPFIPSNPRESLGILGFYSLES